MASRRCSPPPPTRRLQASLQHVVVTYDPVNGRRIYVNGNYTGDADPLRRRLAQRLGRQLRLVLGNETSGNRSVEGRAAPGGDPQPRADRAQVQQNFAAGVGERYFLLFNVSDQVGVPQSYVMFEASQYDSYSYLFDKPTFISLDPTRRRRNIPIKGLRIGVNGVEARVGPGLRPARHHRRRLGGQRSADVGTVIPLNLGPDGDEFFLTFERSAPDRRAHRAGAAGTPAGRPTVRRNRTSACACSTRSTPPWRRSPACPHAGAT
jgi:hypothetical protein